MSAVVPDKEHVKSLKRSFEILGPLQDVVIDQNGKTLVGKHRQFTTSNWPVKIHSCKDELEAEMVITHGNVQRVITKEEQMLRFERIARFIAQKGVRKCLLPGMNCDVANTDKCEVADDCYVSVPAEKVSATMFSLLPYSPTYIERLLPKEFKQPRVKPDAITPGTKSPVGTNQSDDEPAETTSQQKVELIDENAKRAEDNLSIINAAFKSEDTAIADDGYPFPECKCRECSKKEVCPNRGS